MLISKSAAAKFYLYTNAIMPKYATFCEKKPYFCQKLIIFNLKYVDKVHCQTKAALTIIISS